MRLKKEIRQKNTTQEWLAHKIGVPFGTFRKWMTRKTYPNIQEGIEIAKYLETTVEFLVTGIRSDELNSIEKKLINSFRKLNNNDKTNTILAVNAWADKKINK